MILLHENIARPSTGSDLAAFVRENRSGLELAVAVELAANVIVVHRADAQLLAESIQEK